VSQPFSKFAILFLLSPLFLAACSANQIAATPTQGTLAELIPYQTETLSPAVASPSEIDLNQPTPTPAIYTVVSGDTFFSIATQLGISFDALIAANPGVNPRLLIPGTTLILPSASGTEQTGLSTPTPVGVTLGKTKCYASTASELWCFVTIQNPLEVGVENLIAAVQLLSLDGSVLANLEAMPPINLLEAGRAMPLVAYSNDVPSGWTTPRGQLFGAYSVSGETNYYLPAQIQDSSIAISEDGLSAKVIGRVEIINGEVGTIWVLAVAYDAGGDAVGFRRWESEGQVEFETTVYSLGPVIDSVDLLVEVRR
jgi:LysM repeat protein